MKRYFVVAIAVLALVAVAMPASAKVEFSYGGLFRARVLDQHDFAANYTQSSPAGVDLSEENLSRIDQRLRLFFTFTASENLKLVTKFEANEIWGNSNTSGRVGADQPDLVVKNSYIDFNIPNGMLPINAKVGVQGINLMNSWLVDDDFASANLTFKFNPSLKASIGYIGGRNDDVFNEQENIDDLWLVVDYVCGPFSAAFAGFAQWGRDTNVSADPQTVINTPVSSTNQLLGTGGVTHASVSALNISTPTNFFRRYLANAGFGGPFTAASFSSNQLYNLGFDLRYKVDYLSAYLTFIKNLGSVDILAFNSDGTGRPTSRMSRTMDYEGWMVDAGLNYFCGPWTLNVGGFYTSGPEDIADSFGSANNPAGNKTGDIDWFTYPLATSKYFSEIIGGGIFDNRAPMHEDLQWRGYPMPSNLWTVTAGAAWQVLPSTKLAFSYWYFGTSEDVVSGPKRPGDFFSQQEFLNDYFTAQNLTKNDLQFDSEIGHEFNLGLTQKIVDGLVLDVVGAYLIAGDAYSLRSDDQDAYEFGARLQWSF